MKASDLVQAFAILLLTSGLASAEGWGSLTGRFVVEGDPPTRADLSLGNDPVCHAVKPVDESVLVGKQGGLANAMVYLRPPRGSELPLPPGDAARTAQPAELTNRQCAFSPRVAVLRTGQPLVVRNADPTAHNTKFDLVRNTAINQVIPAEGSVTLKLETAESLPTPVSCNIHPFMRGYVMVRSDPYAAVSGPDGRFRIEAVPAGEHQFQFWHESGYLKNVPFGGDPLKGGPANGGLAEGGATDRRGRIRLTITDGDELDLGDVRVPAEFFQAR